MTMALRLPSRNGMAWAFITSAALGVAKISDVSSPGMYSPRNPAPDPELEDWALARWQGGDDLLVPLLVDLAEEGLGLDDLLPEVRGTRVIDVHATGKGVGRALALIIGIVSRSRSTERTARGCCNQARGRRSTGNWPFPPGRGAGACRRTPSTLRGPKLDPRSRDSRFPCRHASGSCSPATLRRSAARRARAELPQLLIVHLEKESRPELRSASDTRRRGRGPRRPGHRP